MVFCNKCGAQMEDDSKFCMQCGTPREIQTTMEQTVEAPVQPTFQPISPVYSAIPQEPKKAGKGPIIAFFSIAAVAIVAIVAVLVMMFIKEPAEVDLSKYITIEFEGQDTMGIASVEFDETQLLIGILEAQGEDPSDAISSKLSLTLNALLNSVEMEVSQTENLSNGQKITVTIKYDSLLMEENEVNFINSTTEFTVKNLVELIAVDPFEDVTVTYSGIAPEGHAYVENASDIDCVRWCDFEFDKNGALQNGDVITLYVSEQDVEYAVNSGYKFTATSKEYTVEGLRYYYNALDEISDEHMGWYQEAAIERIEDYYDDAEEYYGVVMEDLEYMGAYFRRCEEDAWYNRVILMYTAKVSSKEGDFDPAQIYIPISIDGMLVETDQTINYIGTELLGYFSIEDQYYSMYGYVSGDVFYTEVIKDTEDTYVYEASEDMPEFTTTTDKNELPAGTQAPVTGTEEETTEDRNIFGN